MLATLRARFPAALGLALVVHVLVLAAPARAEEPTSTAVESASGSAAGASTAPVGTPVFDSLQPAPAASSLLVWRGPGEAEGALGTWLTMQQATVAAGAIAQRDSCWNDLGDCQAGQVIKCQEDAVKGKSIVWWVVGALVLGAAGGALAAKSIQ